MTTPLVCKGCDGEGEIECIVGTYTNGGDIISLESCETCGGTGNEPCSNCGDDATEMFDGGAYCHLCAEAEREWDAAESVMPAAEVRP